MVCLLSLLIVMWMRDNRENATARNAVGDSRSDTGRGPRESELAPPAADTLHTLRRADDTKSVRR